MRLLGVGTTPFLGEAASWIKVRRILSEEKYLVITAIAKCTIILFVPLYVALSHFLVTRHVIICSLLPCKEDLSHREPLVKG